MSGFPEGRDGPISSLQTEKKDSFVATARRQRGTKGSNRNGGLKGEIHPTNNKRERVVSNSRGWSAIGNEKLREKLKNKRLRSCDGLNEKKHKTSQFVGRENKRMRGLNIAPRVALLPKRRKKKKKYTHGRKIRGVNSPVG